MPTYRVMDSDGIILDKSRAPTDIGSEEVIRWYKDMLTGIETYHQLKGLANMTC